jgi:hypothetical protein
LNREAASEDEQDGGGTRGDARRAQGESATAGGRKKMTGSQVKSAVGLVLTTVASACAALFPILQPLPLPYNKYASYVSIAGALAGALLTAWNQSLSSDHVSVPVERITPAMAKNLGVADQVQGTE